MFRIDDPTASPTLPAPSAAGAPGYFTGGDPATGEQPTTVTQDWANMVQEEIVAVILAAGIALDKTNRAQLLAALDERYGESTAGSNANGYWEKRPNGIIEQWGTIAGRTSEGDMTITFPVPFTDINSINLIGMPVNSDDQGGYDTWVQRVSKTLTGGVLRLQWTSQSGTQSILNGVDWRAVGK